MIDTVVIKPEADTGEPSVAGVSWAGLERTGRVTRPTPAPMASTERDVTSVTRFLSIEMMS
jgi:hypothetical protein